MHHRTHTLEEKLIRSESSDFEKLKAFKKLAEDLETELHDNKALLHKLASVIEAEFPEGDERLTYAKEAREIIARWSAQP